LSALDPLQESVHRALMRLYSDLGRRAGHRAGGRNPAALP
jgi:hypothetical protein